MEPIYINHKGRAEEYLKQAKSLSSGSCFGSVSKIQKEEAIDYLIKAANQYKLDKDWENCLKSYISAVDLATEIGHYNIATYCIEVASMYNKLGNIDGQVFYLQKAGIIYSEAGQSTSYAKIQKDIAEIYDKQKANPIKAIEHYKNAADVYETERGHNSSYVAMNIKIAELLLANTTDFASLNEAKRIYETMASNSVDGPTRFHVKSYLLNAILALIVLGDAVASRRAYDQYIGEFALFNKSEEAELCKQILDALDEQDVAAYTVAVTKYAQTKSLDGLHTKLLLTVKERLMTDEKIQL